MVLEHVLQSQRDYFATGQTKSLSYRKEALENLAKALEEFRPTIFRTMKEELHQSEEEIAATEWKLVEDQLALAMKELKNWSATTRAKDGGIFSSRETLIKKEPLGVVLIIAPWCMPLSLCLVPMISAIAAGNCVIVKPSKKAPKIRKVICDLLEFAFDSHFVHGVKDDYNYDYILKLRYDSIFFTGTARVGRLVMRSASEYLTPVTLQLGGKNPCIVDTSANLKKAANSIANAKLTMAGQTCLAPDYLLVADEIVEDFLDELKEALRNRYKALKDQEGYGRIIDLHHFMRLMRLIEREPEKWGGEAEDATFTIGPAIFPQSSFGSDCMKEEIFGPILPIIPYTNLEHALDKVKEMPKALCCYIFSADKQLAEQLVEELSFGGGCINACGDHFYNSHLPFGGVGNSGMGKYHGKAGFDLFTHEKGILTNRQL